MFPLPQLHTKSLCVLALQNSQFEASTSSRPQTVNFEALGHKAILHVMIRVKTAQKDENANVKITLNLVLYSRWRCPTGTFYSRPTGTFYSRKAEARR